MNNELRLQLDKVKELIKNHPDVKEYNALATQVNESTFIKEKEETLKKMQKELVYLTNDNKNKEYEELKVKYKQLKKKTKLTNGNILITEIKKIINYKDSKDLLEKSKK